MISPFSRRRCSTSNFLPVWCLLTLLVLLLGTAASAQAVQSEHPLTLRALLDSLQVSHPLVGAAAARVRAARGSRATAGAFGNPVVSYQVDNTPFPGGQSINGLDREAITTATLPLEPLYQRGARVTRANADIRAVEADMVVSRQRLALDAIRAYYRVALGQITTGTSRDLSAWLDTVVAYNQLRVKEGVTSEADLLRSRLERDRTAADATVAEAELLQARAELEGLMGTSSGTVQVAAATTPLTMPATSSQLRSVLATRGEVRAARERLASAAAGVAAEQRMMIRQLGATIGTKQTAGTTSLVAGLSLPIPLFDANRGEVQRASAQRDAAAYELAAQERVTSAEVAGAYRAARLLTDRVTPSARVGANNLLTRADEVRRIALGAYREGAVPLIQVIDAARAWGEARNTYYRTLYAQHQSVLNLLAAEGSDLFASSSITLLNEPAR